MATWEENYHIPNEVIKTYYPTLNTSGFVQQSDLIGNEVFQALQKHLVDDISNCRVLDFGCGIGRPLFMLVSKAQIPTHACDVNKDAIDFLKSQTAVMPALLHSSFEPPLPYPDNFFDAIYSISIWTHFELKDEELWLAEMKRILKPGGIAMISFLGPNALSIRHEREPDWRDVSHDDLENRGRIFIEYKTEKEGSGSSYTPRWGTTMHTPKYISDNWPDFLSVVEIAEDALPASAHSYVILRK